MRHRPKIKIHKSVTGLKNLSKGSNDFFDHIIVIWGSEFFIFIKKFITWSGPFKVLFIVLLEVLFDTVIWNTFWIGFRCSEVLLEFLVGVLDKVFLEMLLQLLLKVLLVLKFSWSSTSSSLMILKYSDGCSWSHYWNAPWSALKENL